MIESLTNLNIKGACFFDESLDNHTTFNIGGRVKMWIEPKDLDDLKCALKEITLSGLKWRVIGNGSNILAGESGLPDIVIKLNNFNKLKCEGNIIKAESGVSLANLIGFSVEQNLSGLEFLTGIPGLTGGAIKGNAGAQGKNTGSILKEIHVMDNKGDVYRIPKEKIHFGYRYSDIRNDLVILEGVFGLSQGDSYNINSIVKNYISKRKENFPTEPSAGCVFKNPKDISAGRLIDGLGLRGFTIGKAMVSHKHANIIVNLGGACSKDVYSLVKYVQNEVYNKTGIKLELEIECWGDF